MTDDMQSQLMGWYENTVGEVAQLGVFSDGFVIAIYPVSEYAKNLDLSPDTIRRYISEGKLIGIKIGGAWYVQFISFVRAGKPLDELPF